MLLKSGTWWATDWNKIILPAIKGGIIKQVSAARKDFLRTHQLYNGVLEEEGCKFRVVAWGFTNNDPHVHVELIEGPKK